MIRLIDVSAAQGIVDWRAAARAGIAGAYLKCTDGNSPGRDAFFDRNVGNARAAGLVVGGYHFAYPLPSHAAGDGRTPEEQARRYVVESHGLGSMAGDMPPALDLEWPSPEAWRKWGCTGPQMLDWALAYLAELERLWGRKPAIYTYPWIWGACDGGVRDAFAAFPLWLADYPYQAAEIVRGRAPSDGETPRHLAPWERATLWQWSGGVTRLADGTPVDSDVFLGDEAAFARFCGREP